jgi:kynureninase
VESKHEIIIRSPANLRAEFVPQPGAAGYQLSNPSILDLTAVIASLEVFGMASIGELRRKSVSLTTYLESLLLRFPIDAPSEDKAFTILTPKSPDDRGAQVSVRLDPGLLDFILKELEGNGVIVDERKPDVIRVAPAPLYNNYMDVWNFVQIFLGACRKAVKERGT